MFPTLTMLVVFSSFVRTSWVVQSFSAYIVHHLATSVRAEGALPRSRLLRKKKQSNGFIGGKEYQYTTRRS